MNPTRRQFLNAFALGAAGLFVPKKAFFFLNGNPLAPFKIGRFEIFVNSDVFRVGDGIAVSQLNGGLGEVFRIVKVEPDRLTVQREGNLFCA